MLGKSNEAKKIKRSKNKEYSTGVLIKNKVSFESQNNGCHLKMVRGNYKIYFTPSTGKFVIINKVMNYRNSARGVAFLMTMLDLVKWEDNESCISSVEKIVGISECWKGIPSR